MDTATITKEFVLTEVAKLQYLYKLKNIIRYNQSRPAQQHTESVAEHLYGMQLLAQYFMQCEPRAYDIDAAKVQLLITIHDLDEIETGDTVGYLKTAAMYDAEAAATQTVLQNAPYALQEVFTYATLEYSAQKTPEARFVKALDRFEPLIQLYSTFGKTVLQELGTTIEQFSRIKEPYLQPFPVMYAYYEIIQRAMVDEQYFR